VGKANLLKITRHRNLSRFVCFTFGRRHEIASSLEVAAKIVRLIFILHLAAAFFGGALRLSPSI
jgi:hypothetical protein